MNKHRNRFEIVADMLMVARLGAKKTHIMYGANLSYQRFCKYLSRLMELELIKVEPSAQIFTLTEKGEQYLDAYQSYVKLLNEIREASKSRDRMLRNMLDIPLDKS